MACRGVFAPEIGHVKFLTPWPFGQRSIAVHYSLESSEFYTAMLLLAVRSSRSAFRAPTGTKIRETPCPDSFDRARPPRFPERGFFPSFSFSLQFQAIDGVSSRRSNGSIDLNLSFLYLTNKSSPTYCFAPSRPPAAFKNSTNRPGPSTSISTSTNLSTYTVRDSPRPLLRT